MKLSGWMLQAAGCGVDGSHSFDGLGQLKEKLCCILD